MQNLTTQRPRERRKSLRGALLCAAAAAYPGTMLAADAQRILLKAPPHAKSFDWSGLYVGAHAGYGFGRANVALQEPPPTRFSNNFSGLIGGLQIGYNWVLPSNLLFGIEADASFANYLDSSAIVASRATALGGITEQLDFIGTIRGRVGYRSHHWLVYGTGGFAYMGERFLNDLPNGLQDKHLNIRAGWTAGGGIEYAFAPHWSARLEYLYYAFDSANVRFATGQRWTSATDFQSIRLGLNRKIDLPGTRAAAETDVNALSESDRWEIHGQTTFIGQGYPAFPALYTGPNSLTPTSQLKNTFSNGVYLNFRIWDGGELYYNPELLQGFGLNDTAGAAGFPNGEAQKSNFPYPRYNTSRLYLRQTFGLGGEQEELARGLTQLPGKVDVSRVTVQVGKFSVGDVFDGNSYAKDPRRDFMNWSIWASGAFDYAADRVGLAYGGTADFNQKDWAFRAGYFLVPAVSNSNNFDSRVFERGMYVGELETRFAPFGQPGKLRAIAWLNSVFSGSYRETLDNPALNLDIAQTRRGRIKYGFALNLEQALTENIGLFGRASWNNGKNEIVAFTDIDASVSGGLSIKGAYWGRPTDTVGIAGAINALSRDHRDFIAAGGLGVLIGDGRLNYRTERVFETYYSLALNSAFSLTGDYQLITNPAYNADRGPVHVFSGRLHGEF